MSLNTDDALRSIDQYIGNSFIANILSYKIIFASVVVGIILLIISFYNPTFTNMEFFKTFLYGVMVVFIMTYINNAYIYQDNERKKQNNSLFSSGAMALGAGITGGMTDITGGMTDITGGMTGVTGGGVGDITAMGTSEGIMNPDIVAPQHDSEEPSNGNITDAPVDSLLNI